MSSSRMTISQLCALMASRRWRVDVRELLRSTVTLLTDGDGDDITAPAVKSQHRRLTTTTTSSSVLRTVVFSPLGPMTT